MPVQNRSPAGLVDIAAVGGTRTIWPYTTEGLPPSRQDPVNLVFVGEADPRNLRAALLAVDGDRTGWTDSAFADHPLLAARWRDAIGGLQAAYSAEEGWTGSAIQLECGDFGSLRFHLRLFPAGGWTLGSAHLDLHVPGTGEHEVVAWDLAQRVVAYDLARGGWLDERSGSAELPPCHPALYRTVDPRMLEAMGDLRTALERAGAMTSGGELRTRAPTVLKLDRRAPEPVTTARDLVLRLDGVVPKPFCNQGVRFIRVEGPLELRQEVRTGTEGELLVRVRGAGELQVTPVDAATGTPAGHPAMASIRERQGGEVADGRSRAWLSQLRRIVDARGRAELQRTAFRIGPSGHTHFSSREWCAAVDEEPGSSSAVDDDARRPYGRD